MSKRKTTAGETAGYRFNLIAPLIAGTLDKGRRSDLMREIAECNGVDPRTLRRYISAWK